MECLENVLGMQGGCAELASTQSIFINSSVAFAELGQITDQNETASVEAFFRERRTLAVREMVAEIQDNNKPNYTFKSIVENEVAGIETDELELSVETADLVGVSLKRKDPNEYLRYRITEIMLFLNSTGNVTVTAYDLDTGVTLASVVVSTIAGQISTEYVDWSFRKRNVAILYNSTGKNPYKTTLHGSGCSTCKGGGWMACNKAVTGRMTTVATGSSVINNNTVAAKDMGGLKVRYSVDCDYETWLCSIRASLALPILWKTAEKVMEYGIFQTSRENRSTKLDREQLKQRQMMYNEQYTQAMTRIFKTMVFPKNDTCFVCKRTSKYVTMLP